MAHKKNRLVSIGEFGLIDLIAKGLKKKPGIVAIGDDAAVIPAGQKDALLLTADMLAEGVHFTKKMAAKDIGRKSLAVSISDVAAMGGVPKYAVVSLAVPPKTSIRFVRELYQGMETLARQFDVLVVGGDTIKNNKVVINITLLGEAKKRHVVLRSGAKTGNKVFVTGHLGRSFQTHKHLTFRPRVPEAQYLVKNFSPTAMIDISDGLIADLGHILKASRAGAVVYEKEIPKAKEAGLKQALYDGEDFELLFTVSAKDAVLLQKTGNLKFKFFCIGEIVDRKQGLMLIDKKGKQKPVKIKGFSHF